MTSTSELRDYLVGTLSAHFPFSWNYTIDQQGQFDPLVRGLLSDMCRVCTKCIDGVGTEVE